MRTMLGGEGPSELGRYARRHAFRKADDVGVLEALARLVLPEPDIADGTLWKAIRHYKSGGHRSREERLVLGLCLKAKEGSFDAVVFSRDRDGDVDRERAIQDARAEAKRMRPEHTLMGGVAVEAIESWMIAATAQEQADNVTDPKARWESNGLSRQDAVEAIESQGVDGLRRAMQLSPSLKAWVESGPSPSL